MKHTIISWDCTFRNFFHLIGALAEQDYPKDEYEFIFVEQRSRASSDAFNHQQGFQSLNDTVEAYRDRYAVRALFLDQDDTHPYHLGVACNVAIRQAQGQIISVMDGDVLVRPKFLASLDRAHEQLGTILNLRRRYATHPVGVDKTCWYQQTIDFDQCLAQCPDRDRPIRQHVGNKGPLISAPAPCWHAVGLYDEHRLWSTAATRLGQDVNRRMEIHLNRVSRTVPDQVCVHPWHPIYSRRDSVPFLITSLHDGPINWSTRNHETSHEVRRPLIEAVYQKYHWLIEAHIAETPLESLPQELQHKLSWLVRRHQFRKKLSRLLPLLKGRREFRPR